MEDNNKKVSRSTTFSNVYHVTKDHVRSVIEKNEKKRGPNSISLVPILYSNEVGQSIALG